MVLLASYQFRYNDLMKVYCSRSAAVELEDRVKPLTLALV